jgi:hypothetical protein
MTDPNKKDAVELNSDAWSRFERAVDVVAKSPPQHRAKGGKSPKGGKPKKTLKKKPA